MVGESPGACMERREPDGGRLPGVPKLLEGLQKP